MKKQERVAVSLEFLGDEIDLVKQFYDEHKYTHKEIYLSGIAVLRERDVEPE